MFLCVFINKLLYCIYINYNLKSIGINAFENYSCLVSIELLNIN